MMQREYTHNTKLLWGLVVLALAYGYLLYFLPALTGHHLLDGSIGVILGLYICSRPAAHAVDLLFFERGAFRRVTSNWYELGWVALNLVVLGLGCFVIISGVMRLVE
jgi:hypothetical protein